jgi:hypothetical protein
LTVDVGAPEEAHPSKQPVKVKEIPISGAEYIGAGEMGFYSLQESTSPFRHRYYQLPYIITSINKMSM